MPETRRNKGGRPQGSVNRYTGALKELFLLAAENVGDRLEIGPNGERNGEGGALAFLEVCAIRRCTCRWNRPDTSANCQSGPVVSPSPLGFAWKTHGEPPGAAVSRHPVAPARAATRSHRRRWDRESQSEAYYVWLRLAAVPKPLVHNIK
jgi:hypothetical protein